MTLEIEKLHPSLDQMAQAAAGRQRNRRYFVDELLAVLETFATNWTAIEQALVLAGARADEKHYRSARPFDQTDPLNAAIDAPTPPSQATIIATDGSQIMPDRHAAHLYYLINIGGIVYYHGSGMPPAPFSNPELHFPHDDRELADFITSSGQVSVERDKREISTLADYAWDLRRERPLLAILDQRLLYWPIGGTDSALNEAVRVWLEEMTKLHASKAYLTGYIDRPMTAAVVTLLLSLMGMDDPDFDWRELGKRSASGNLSDAHLFRRILAPGQRSKVFSYVSPPNTLFAKYARTHEICFFYLNPAQHGRRIARVDIPHWVAVDEAAVNIVHALVMDQCRILGDYPYVIARADEMAVVGHQDNEELNFLIDLYMQRYGISGQLTAKQSSKGLARGGKTRHEGV